MPWWNKPEGSITPKVTVDRIAHWFDVNDLAYDRHDSGEAIVSGFGDYGYVVAIPDESLLQVRGMFFTGLVADLATRSRLRDLLNDVHCAQVFPTLSIMEDDDEDDAGRGRLHVCAEVVVSIAKGMNDDQLHDLLDVSAHIILRTFEELSETLGIDGAEDPTGAENSTEPGTAEEGDSE